MAWKNWAGNQRCNPGRGRCTRRRDASSSAVGEERGRTRQARSRSSARGTASPTVRVTDGMQIVLDKYNQRHRVDTRAKTVTVQAGSTIARAEQGARRRTAGDAEPGRHRLPDDQRRHLDRDARHRRQAAGHRGAGDRPRHRYGRRIGRVVLAERGTARSSRSARVGVGALGALSTVTLQCVPEFHLRAVEEPMRVDDVLADIDEHVDGNDHFEFFWVPHTGWALTKTNNRTDVRSVGGAVGLQVLQGQDADGELRLRRCDQARPLAPAGDPAAVAPGPVQRAGRVRRSRATRSSPARAG